MTTESSRFNVPDPDSENPKRRNIPVSGGESQTAQGETFEPRIVKSDGDSARQEGFGAKEQGREFIGKVREVLEGNPITGKMIIAYHNMWTDKHEAKSTELSAKLNGFDSKAGQIDSSRKEIETTMAKLKADNVPGFEFLPLKLKTIEEQKGKLMHERSKAQRQLELRREKAKSHVEKRNTIADRLISRYDERLEPMKENLEGLNTCRNQVDTHMVRIKERHDQASAKFDEYEKDKEILEDSYRGLGMSEKQIRNDPSILDLEAYLKKQRKVIATEGKEITRRLSDIEAKIKRAQEKANPYVEKRRKFELIKQGKPIDFKVVLKTNEGADVAGLIEKGFGNDELEAVMRGEESNTPKSEVEQKASNLEAVKEKFSTEFLISDWNEHLKKSNKGKGKPALIEPKAFLEFVNKTEKGKLTLETKLTPKEFSDLIKAYYNRNKVGKKKFVGKAKTDKFAGIPNNPNPHLN